MKNGIKTRKIYHSPLYLKPNHCLKLYSQRSTQIDINKKFIKIWNMQILKHLTQ